MSRALNPDDISFEVARGAHVGITLPEEGFEPRLDISWPEFVKLLTDFTISDSKVGAYVCRPMGNDGKRSDANAMPWPLLPLDLDELLPSDLTELDDWCSKFGGDVIVATTFSHTAEAPRARLWILCDRPVTATEHLFLFKAFSQEMPFKLDPATAKPSQPIYLPRCPADRKPIAFAKHYPGRPLPVDSLLQRYQGAIRERAARDAGAKFPGKGVRSAGGVIEAFNKNFDLPELLEAHGYKRKTRSRYVAPASKSGRAAVTLHEWGLISFHEPDHDPLSKRDELNVPRVLDSFATYAILEHDDDFIPAWRAATKIVKQRGWLSEDTEHISDKPIAYRIFNTTDAITTLTARNMIVDGVLEAESITLTTGQSNSGKTTVLQYLALCVARGDKFHGHTTHKGRVLWIAGEDQYNARLRLAAMCDEYGIASSSVDENLLILPQAVAVLDRASMDAFHDAVDRDVGKSAEFAVVVIDSKSMCWGGEDENSNDENAQFIREVGNHFKNRYRAAVVITHHLTKNKEKEEQSARGASALINNIDHEWRFDMRPSSMVSILEPGSKLRIARWDPMRFQIKTVEISETRYPHLKNNLGQMPQISIPEPTNQFGTSPRQMSEDQSLADLLDALKQAKGKKGDTALAKLMGKITDDSDGSEQSAARGWIKRKVAKLIEQRLVDDDRKVLPAGDAFLESVRMGENLAGVGESEREPGQDDE